MKYRITINSKTRSRNQQGSIKVSGSRSHRQPWGRISLYSIGQGQRQKPDLRYKILGEGNDWKLIDEIGSDARTAMRAEGMCAFASYRGEDNGRYFYSIGNLSPYGGFDLPHLYKTLNEVEALRGNDVWGGSDSCGGSPRELGSSLCPNDLTKLIEECGATLKSHECQAGRRATK